MAFRYPPEIGLRNAIRLCRSSAKPSHVSSGQRNYKAVACQELGKPLHVVQMERRTLQSNEIRVAVKRAGVNFADILVTQGKYQEKIPLPFVPGTEVMGEVIEVGSDVDRMKPGDSVVGLVQRWGGYSEEVVGPELLFHPISSQLSPDEGAAVVASYGTAGLALHRTAGIKEGDVVLVTAAAGALGLAAVDLAVNVFKANVIGACGGPEKCALVLKYGAKFVIDYKTENLRDRIKEITKGRGVDIVVDPVGGQVLEDSLKCLAFEGRLLTLGYSSGQIPKIPANLLLVKNISVQGVYWGSYSRHKPEVHLQSVATAVRLWQEGRIKPHVGKVFPLSQANEALEFIAKRQSTGKVILDCTKI